MKLLLKHSVYCQKGTQEIREPRDPFQRPSQALLNLGIAAAMYGIPMYNSQKGTQEAGDVNGIAPGCNILKFIVQQHINARIRDLNAKFWQHRENLRQVTNRSSIEYQNLKRKTVIVHVYRKGDDGGTQVP